MDRISSSVAPVEVSSGLGQDHDRLVEVCDEDVGRDSSYTDNRPTRLVRDLGANGDVSVSQSIEA